jgi:Zn-finger nucleic acid-binding protein
MEAVVIGKASLRECPHCEGIWADATSLEQICADREEQAAVLGIAATVSSPGSVELETNIRYVPCPVCRQLMNRVNFAHCSAVIVDVCGRHGTWFDKDELRRIVEFIRAGGLEKARTREIEELEQRRRQLTATQTASVGDSRPVLDTTKYDLWSIGLSAAAVMLNALLR